LKSRREDVLWAPPAPTRLAASASTLMGFSYGS
jgi:hypothetical protein